MSGGSQPWGASRGMLLPPEQLSSPVRAAVVRAAMENGWGEVEVRGWFPPRDPGDPLEVLVLARQPQGSRWVPLTVLLSSAPSAEVVGVAIGW